MIYGQDNSIKDTEYGKVSRSLSVWFDANNNGKIDVDAVSKSETPDIFENISTDIRRTYVASDINSLKYWESVIEVHVPCTGDGKFITKIDDNGNVTCGTLWFVCNTFLRNDGKPIQMVPAEFIGE
jgi:hypothetical protein